MTKYQAPTAPRPVEPARCRQPWWGGPDGQPLCFRVSPRSGPLAAGPAPAGCLLPATAAGCVRAGGGRQPSPPAPLVGPRWRRLAGFGDAQPPQQGRSPRQSRRGTQRPRQGHWSAVGADPAASGWPGGACHGERHHPHSCLLLAFRLSALRPAGRRLHCHADLLARLCCF